MKLIVFSKSFKEESIDGLIKLARDYGFEGYDLCVRKGYQVNPDNVSEEMVSAVTKFEKEGLVIPMVTGEGNLLTPDNPTVEPILSAMDKANVRLLKLGYFRFNPQARDYWEEVDKIRRTFEGWQKLGKKYNIKICYHTHSHLCMGLNCAALAHLIKGFDPNYIGAYIDPGHMKIEGEQFSFGTAMIKDYLSIIGLKDVMLTRVAKNDHGAVELRWVEAGKGMVDWTEVFTELVRIGFDGPISIHCEFKKETGEEFMNAVKSEVAYFKKKRDEALVAQKM